MYSKKLKSILAALLLMVAGLQMAMAQKMIVTLNDNSKVTYSISQVKEVVFVEAEEPMNDEHEWVDLGLPSGTLWATCNVGANSPEEYGDYFAWGETKPKSIYDWSTYKWCNGSSKTMTKYCTRSDYGYNGFTDNLTELQPEDDAATANWGSGWQMPSLAQIKELYDSSYTTTEWTQVNGVNGRKITSKSNGNSIFLPAAGYRYDASLSNAGSYGYYWSRSLYTSYSLDAYYLCFGSDGIIWSNYRRSYGRSVRPVRNPEKEHEYVDLGLPSGTKWATCNVGANSPEEYGDYLAWGETAPKSDYSWSTYKWCKGSSVTMTKYCTYSSHGYNGFTDNLTELQPEDDAATANWGSPWRMPSLDQFQELFNSSYTTSEWTQLNGVNGRMITSKRNGNSIFLPAAGYRYGTSLYRTGSYGNYWSSSLYPSGEFNAYYLYFGSGDCGWSKNGRGDGRSVRAVRP